MTTTTTPAIVRTWRRRIESGTFTLAECRSWAQTVATLAAGRTPRKRTAIESPDADALYDLLDARGVDLTPDHTARGLAWLLDPLRPMGPDFPYDLVREHFARFRYYGHGVAIDRDWPMVPVWRIEFSDDGPPIDYIAPSWQSGGHPEWSLMSDARMAEREELAS